ncbi:MAG TPA: YeeE/YedE thiosulfate transporter family protein [Myxococcota bacterium]|nr:YeeE/YedE thiosulfate transporter family protein [Myxococcota bacterium]
MSTRETRPPRAYVDPYLGGALLGVVLFLAFFITGNGLGASGAISHVQVAILGLFAQSHVDQVGYFAEIGGGAKNALDNAGVYMLFGTFLGGALSGILARRWRPETRTGPNVSVTARWVYAFIGGAIMGYGARLARGCTSGQALSGGAVLSVGSFAFMFAVFGGGYALAWFVRRLWN